MEFPGSRKPRKDIHMGSYSHTRYGHDNSPSEMHVRCPRCKGKAIARRDASVLDSLPKVAWGREMPWSLACTACMHRADRLLFDDLTEPWYQVAARGETLFAWNRDHLVMLGRYFAGESVQGDPYEHYVTYVRRSWLKVRKDLAKAIQRRLEQGPD